MKEIIALLVLSAVGAALLSFVILHKITNLVKCDISCYAIFENGETVKVDSIIAVPILSVEQIDRMWPEYYAETIVKIADKEITLRSKPFLFCDNPEMEGNYAGRDVYCPSAGELE